MARLFVGVNTWAGVLRRVTRPNEPIGVAISVQEIIAACDIHYYEVDSSTEWQATGVRLASGTMFSVAACIKLIPRGSRRAGRGGGGAPGGTRRRTP